MDLISGIGQESAPYLRLALQHAPGHINHLDLVKKILHGGVQSAAFNPFDEDFSISNPAAGRQLHQAGSTCMEEADGDPCHGIMDLSDSETAKSFKETL